MIVADYAGPSTELEPAMSDRSGAASGPPDSWSSDAFDPGTAEEQFRSAISERFEIEREVGRGGAGIVYLAHDRARGERVALKTLRPELAASVGIARFAQEVELGQAMQHPNIVPILDSGTAAGRLYCTMPYVEGKTLRDRLRAEGQLSVDEAFGIARQLAAALDYAHTHPLHVVHRDLKPANVLLSGDVALLADFGIARALTTSSAGRLTESGIALGTVEYMSPEQIEARKDVDRRADIYALGCVVFEMLAGEPPFTGPTSQSVQARTLHEAPRSLRIVRPNVSRAADAAIARALAKVPADRFATAGEFVAALTGPEIRAAADRSAGRRRTLGGIGIAIAAIITLGVLDASRADSILRRTGVIDPALDSQRYAVVLRDTAATTRLAATAFRSALARWKGVTSSDSVPVFATAGIRAGEISRRARSLGARQYITITTGTGIGGETLVRAELRSAQSDSFLAQAGGPMALAGAGPSETAETLVDRLLFADAQPRDGLSGRPSATVVPSARRAYLHGRQALEAADFAAASQAFEASATADPGYAEALVWGALVRYWLRSPTNPWEQLVVQATAAASRSELGTSDSLHLAGLQLAASRRGDDACAIWARAATRIPDDPLHAYALGFCLRYDRIVLRDPRTGSWRFRASYERAIRAYERAFQLRPGLIHALGPRALSDLQELLAVRTAFVRPGSSLPPEVTRFRSFPAWAGDTLAFIPLPSAATLSGAAPARLVTAIQRQRERLLRVVRLWRAEFPARSDAAEALAVSMDLLGLEGVLDTLRVARTLVAEQNAAEATRLAAVDVMMRVKHSLPDDLPGLERAVMLADSLLLDRGVTGPVSSLATIAALRGRGAQAARFASAAAALETPSPANATGPALVAYAAVGSPSDSLQRIEARLEQDIGALPTAEQRTPRDMWLHRAAALAYPEYSMRVLRAVASGPPTASTMTAAAVRGDTNGVRAMIRDLSRARTMLRPTDVGIDALLIEASALAAIGDRAAASAHLDPHLSALRLAVLGDLTSVPRAAALVRAAALRAELADALGDPTLARRWARAAQSLWRGVDSTNRILARMTTLAR